MNRQRFHTRRGVACLLLLCLACTVQAAQRRAPEDVGYFIANGDYLDLRIAPDGEHLAALVRSDDAVAIVFLRTDDLDLVGGRKAVGGDTIVDYQWANNERVVFTVAEKYVGWEQPSPTGELFAVDRDGGNFERVFGFRARDAGGGRMRRKTASFASHTVVHLLPDDPRHIIIVEHPWEARGARYYDTRNTYPEVSRLNIYTGRRKRIERLPYRGADVLCDAAGNVRFLRWMGEDATVRSAFRRAPGADWESLAQLLPGDSAPELLYLDEDAGRVYLRGPRGPQQLDTVFAVDLDSGETRTVAGPLPSDIVAVLSAPDSGLPVGVTSLPGKPRHDYIAPEHELARLHRGLRQAFPGQLVRITDADAAGRLLVVRVESDRNPGEFYLFDREARRARFIFANRSWMDVASLPATTPLTVPARDGLSVPALLTLPPQAAGRPAPLLLMIHGGPHGVRDRWTFSESVQLLASRGYAVLRVNFRGSGGYGEGYLEAGYGEWGDAIIDDLVDTVRWVREHYPERVGERLCAHGASFGAYASMMIAAAAPGLVDCVAAYAGIYDLRMLYEEGDVTMLRWGGSYLEQAIGRDPQVLGRFSPVTRAAHIEAPVWLMHGREDERAPLAQARAMHEALEAAGVPVDYSELRGGGHGIYGEAERIDYYGNLLAFLERHLRPAAAD